MKEITLEGTKRVETGKKATKLLRKEGMVPCNVYGEKKGEDGLPVALSFAVSERELRKIVYTPHIYVINLVIDGESHTAVLKELQFHPVTDAVLHVDFYEVNDQKPITIGIPVKLNGLAQGVRDGGRINLSIRKINVTAPYQVIPEHLDIDVTSLQLGKTLAPVRNRRALRTNVYRIHTCPLSSLTGNRFKIHCASGLRSSLASA